MHPSLHILSINFIKCVRGFLHFNGFENRSVYCQQHIVAFAIYFYGACFIFMRIYRRKWLLSNGIFFQYFKQHVWKYLKNVEWVLLVGYDGIKVL